MSAAEDYLVSYQSSKLAGHADSTGGLGLFAAAAITKGELLVSWAGATLNRARFDSLAPELQSISLQIDEDRFLVPTRPSIADRVNHSCEPNAGMSGPTALIALRGIGAGEQISYDYAMSDGSDYDEFICHCGARRCRGRVTGQDWQDPTLWLRYAGHFSPYLERRIRARRAEPGRSLGGVQQRHA